MMRLKRLLSTIGMSLLLAGILSFQTLVGSAAAQASYRLSRQPEAGGLLRPQQQTTPVQLSLPTLSASTGQTLTINLTIDTTAPTRAAQFGLTFNPAVLRCNSIAEGTFYSTWAANNGASTFVFPTPTCNNTTGEVTVMGIVLLGGTGGPVGQGVVATFNFTVLGNGVSPLTLTNVLVADDSPESQALPTTVTNGQVSVGATPTALPASPTPTRTPTSTPTRTPTQPGPTATRTPTPASPPTSTATQPGPGATPTRTPTLPGPTATRTPTPVAPPTGTPVGSATPTLLPGPTPTAPGSPTATLPPSGICAYADVNRDGAINVIDLSLVGERFGETGDPGWIPEDVIPDGSINVLDLSRVGECFGQPPGPTPTGPAPTQPGPSPTLPGPTATLPAPTVTQPGPTVTATPSPPVTVTPPAATKTPPAVTKTPPVKTKTPPAPTKTATPKTKTPPVMTGTPAPITPTPTVTRTPTRTPTPFITNTPLPPVTRTPIPSNARLFFAPALTTVEAAGDTFTVDVMIYTDVASRAAQMSITFDPDVLECQSVTEGGFYRDWATANGGSTWVQPNPPVIDNVKGVIQTLGITILGADVDPSPAHAGGPVGTGVFVSLAFRAKASGASPLVMQDTILVDDGQEANSLVVTTEDGQVIVGGLLTPTRTPSATPTAGTPGPTATPTPTRTPTMTSTAGTPTLTATPSRTPTTTSVVPPTPTPTLPPADTIVLVQPPQGALDAGDQFQVTLAIETIPASRAAQFALSFDPAVIRCDAIAQGTFYSNWAAANGASTFLFPTPTCDNTAGRMTLMGITLLGGTGGPTGSGSLATITFTALANGTSPLALQDVVVADDSPVSQALPVTLINAQVVVGAAPTPAPTATQVPNEADTTLSIRAPSATLALGQAFDVVLEIDTLPPSRAAQFSLSFNPAVLRCEAITEGTFYRAWAAAHGASTFVFPTPVCDNAAGRATMMGITLLGGGSNGPTGTGSLAVYRFTVAGAGTSFLRIEDAIVADASPVSQALPTLQLNGSVSAAASLEEQSFYVPLVIWINR